MQLKTASEAEINSVCFRSSKESKTANSSKSANMAINRSFSSTMTVALAAASFNKEYTTAVQLTKRELPQKGTIIAQTNNDTIQL